MQNWKSLIKLAKVEIYSQRKMYPLGCSWIFNLFWLVVTNLVGTNLVGTNFVGTNLVGTNLDGWGRY